MGGKPRTESFWDPVCDKIHSKLAVWMSFSVSKGGRSTLIKVVLSSIPAYLILIFRMSVGVCKKVEKVFRNF